MNIFNQAVKYGRELLLAGINNGSNGNLSFRSGKKVYITKSGAVLSELSRKDLVYINSAEASSESLAHQIIYAYIKEAGAVLHVHSLSAIALSLKQKNSFIEPLDLEGKYYFKKIPIVTTALVPGAKDLPKKLLDNYKYGAVIVRGHGVFVFGKDVRDCYLKACTIDNICRIILKTK